MEKSVSEKNKRVILVSGMSGAGKSVATRSLEDMGYHVIDNFPVQLVSLLVDMIETSIDPRYSYIALSTSAQDFPAFLRLLKGQNFEVQVLFLDANDSVLLHRYKSTRRTHPLLLSNTCNTLDEAISVERQMFSRNLNNSFITIDTSFLSEKEFKKKLESYFSKEQVPVFSISFESFGYKYGVPLDADLMVDVRFLPNPFYIPEYRHKTGRVQVVNDYIHSFDVTDEFKTHYFNTMDFLVPNYEKEGKAQFIVAVGCTGGMHRSVAMAEALYAHLLEKGYRVTVEHRDMMKNNVEEDFNPHQADLGD